MNKKIKLINNYDLEVRNKKYDRIQIYVDYRIKNKY